MPYFDWAVQKLLVPDVKSSDGHQILLASGYNKPKSADLVALGLGRGSPTTHLADRPLVPAQQKVLHLLI